MPRGELPDFDGTNDSYLVNMTKSIFIMGFSRDVIMKKWEGFKVVFDNFNINKVSEWQDGDVLEAVEDARIVRNMKKIEATVENAKVFNMWIKEYGSIENYITHIEEEYPDFDMRLQVISKSLKMMGPKAAHLFLWSCHRDVPLH